MAQKRMFDKRITDSDKFIDLPNSAKALYFLAGMNADDKGFFQPAKLQRENGFSNDDFKILIAKGYLITFESGVMVITDWNKNNWLDNRRITETEYVNELNMLKLINDRYELSPTESNCLAVAKPSLSHRLASIEENSIEEYSIKESSQEERKNNSLSKSIDYDPFVDIFNRECLKLPKIRTLTDKRKTKIKTFLKTFSLNDWSEICKIANANNFLSGTNDRGWKADFDFLINVNNAVKVLEGKYGNISLELNKNSDLDDKPIVPDYDTVKSDISYDEFEEYGVKQYWLSKETRDKFIDCTSLENCSVRLLLTKYIDLLISKNVKISNYDFEICLNKLKKMTTKVVEKYAIISKTLENDSIKFLAITQNDLEKYKCPPVDIVF